MNRSVIPFALRNLLREAQLGADDIPVTNSLFSRLLLLLASTALPAFAAKPTAPDHWVGTWAAADVEKSNAKGDFLATDTTVRQIVHVSLGGAMVRIELSNQFGTEPLLVSAVHIALAGSDGDIALTSANSLTFSGRAAVTIPAGASVLSDPAGLTLPAFADLTISMFLPAQKISHITMHGSAYQTNYLAEGNAVGERSLPAGSTKKFSNWYFLKAVDVQAPAADAAVVAFGDSITDGTASTPNTNQRWPDLLAKRLAADKSTAGLGVLNLGIGGNRVLHDGTGPSALARFDTDVLAQSGVKYVIVLESINDIGHAYDPKKPYDVVTADDLIAGLTQLAERAHMHGIKIFGATLTPYTGGTPNVGTAYMSPEGEQVREKINAFIRTSKVFDGVIDFEKAAADPANPNAWSAAADHGDHLHPSDAGMKAMADSINLKLFTEK